MLLRYLAWSCLLIGAACATTRGVYHTTPLPTDAGAVRDGLALSTWEADANASVVFAGGDVTIASAWRDGAPSDAAIARSLVMQRELADTIRRRHASLPPLADWAVRWVGIEPNEALRAEVLRPVGGR